MTDKHPRGAQRKIDGVQIETLGEVLSVDPVLHPVPPLAADNPYFTPATHAETCTGIHDPRESPCTR